ncbi:hypothetical protein [Brevibacillus dissolubilis]|uniref:hypothetical protein n=1 Tax=Brevibacillus dissolubilis TaxID=1844116 RepID=UPI001117A073|nr:hypothetical protein [Brevibacillus dissolubilis]
MNSSIFKLLTATTLLLTATIIPTGTPLDTAHAATAKPTPAYKTIQQFEGYAIIQKNSKYGVTYKNKIWLQPTYDQIRFGEYNAGYHIFTTKGKSMELYNITTPGKPIKRASVADGTISMITGQNFQTEDYIVINDRKLQKVTFLNKMDGTQRLSLADSQLILNPKLPAYESYQVLAFYHPKSKTYSLRFALDLQVLGANIKLPEPPVQVYKTTNMRNREAGAADLTFVEIVTAKRSLFYDLKAKTFHAIPGTIEDKTVIRDETNLDRLVVSYTDQNKTKQLYVSGVGTLAGMNASGAMIVNANSPIFLLADETGRYGIMNVLTKEIKVPFEYKPLPNRPLDPPYVNDAKQMLFATAMNATDYKVYDAPLKSIEMYNPVYKIRQGDSYQIIDHLGSTIMSTTHDSQLVKLPERDALGRPYPGGAFGVKTGAGDKETIKLYAYMGIQVTEIPYYRNDQLTFNTLNEYFNSDMLVYTQQNRAPIETFRNIYYVYQNNKLYLTDANKQKRYEQGYASFQMSSTPNTPYFVADLGTDDALFDLFNADGKKINEGIQLQRFKVIDTKTGGFTYAYPVDQNGGHLYVRSKDDHLYEVQGDKLVEVKAQ